MSRFARWVLGHKLVILLAWVTITIVSGISIPSAVNALTFQITVPGREAFETNQAILRLYGGGGNTPPLVPVITLPTGATVRQRKVMAQLAAPFRTLQTQFPQTRIAAFPSTHNSAFLSRDGRTAFGLIYPPGTGAPGTPIPAATAAGRILARATVDGTHFLLSGITPLSTGANNGGGVGVLGEVLIGGIGSLIVLLFVFRSVLAVAPLLMAAAAIPTTFLLIWGLTTLTTVSMFVEYLVGILGLGLGIDYSLLLVTRWREERAAGGSNEEAVHRAMQTAGLSIVFSGTTVAIGLLALVVLPVPFLRSLGFAGMLIPLVSVVVSLTLLPVILASVGPQLAWPSSRSAAGGSGFWRAWARVVVTHSWPAAIGSIVILGALFAAATTVSLASPRADALARSGPMRAGLVSLERSGIGAGAITPIEILVRHGDPTRLAQRLSHLAGVQGAVAPVSWRRRGTAIVEVIPRPDGNSSAGLAVLKRVQAAVHRLTPGAGVGGAPAETQDFVSATYGTFPLMIALIVLITVLLLIRAFRSILLPLKAVFLNLLSVGAAWGIMVLVWQDGFGSKLIWGIPATGATESWLPITVFAFLFGISMDYEVFLLMRMREEYDAERSTTGAIVTGTGRTGRLVTSAALILFLAFLSLSSAPITDVKALATGLGAGVLLDATVVRMLLVPALMRLFGDWNWWLPLPVARALRVPVLPGP